jgi:Tfp pilus assembly protein PilO
MKNLFESIKNSVKRILSNEAISMRIYIYWGLLTIVVFGIFGFLPVSKIFFSNVKLLDQMYQSNLKLEKKIDDLKEAKTKLDIVGEDADILDKFLPSDFEPQTYMVEIASMAGQSGYSLDKVSFGKIENSKVSMNLGMSGKGNLKDLVKSIESSGRITEIENIKLSVGEREDSLNIKVDSYIMVKK